MSYPKAYQILARKGKPSGRTEIFDPALKQFARAYRLGDPKFPDLKTWRRWHRIHQKISHQWLRQISTSRWNEHLVLRGSQVLKAWLGDAAREPGDLDWVLRPSHITPDMPEAQQLLQDLKAIAADFPHIGEAAIRVNGITVDNIWSYERARGRRIVIPWQIPDLPLGSTQMDIVFGEELFTEPVQTTIPSPKRNSSVTLWTADKPLSLAWKLLWLQTDWYPQGKDLYDATLLGEQTSLSPDLLDTVLETYNEIQYKPFTSKSPMNWNIDWENFQREYPWIPGEAKDWQKRLDTALAPLFALRPDK